MRNFACALMLTFALVASGALASTTAISVDGIGGTVSTPNGDFAAAGTVIAFHLRYTNTSDSGFNINNAFRWYSPDGASWTDSAYGNFHGANLGPIGIDTTGLLSKAQFPTLYSLRTFSTISGPPVQADGLSPDSLRFVGAGSDFGQGLLPHTDVRVFSILLQTKVSDSGKTICFDSSTHFPPTGLWRWGVLYGGGSGDYVDPTWSGERCVHLVPPSALATPLMSACPENVSASQCDPLHYDFNATAPGGDPLDVRYMLWAGPGSMDSMTGEWTGDNLEPGQYSLAVNARNVWTGNYSITCWSNVEVTNQPPVFTPAAITVPAVVGQQGVASPQVSNDCDELTFSLVNNSGVEGPVTLNPTTGELSFTPTVNDSARAEPIVMLVTASDPHATDSLTVAWRFPDRCIGIVGNVDCDLTESVDIGDLTTMIDNLFINFHLLCSYPEANCDGDPGINVDIGDLTALIDNLFLTFTPLPACQ